MLGGVPQIKTLIEAQKAQNAETLVVDAGDFSMGTLIQTVFETEAAELKMLGEISCEVTTLGNHEFDYKDTGLANMLQTAAAAEEAVPAMALCNVDWEAMEAAGLTEAQQSIKDAFAAYQVQDYVMLQKGEVRVAVIGVFGTDALACAPGCTLLFKDSVEAVQQTVAEIEAKEEADMILCISHSGTWKEAEKSEDEILAKAVPQLDLIVSGHTHTKLEEPIVHGNTYIVSCGEYGKRIGSLSMKMTGEGVWEMSDYELIEVTPDIPADAKTQAKIESLMESVDRDYLSQFGYERKQVLANNAITFSTVSQLGREHVEHNLGNLIADAYQYAVEQAVDFDGNPVAVAVAPSGTIRGTYAVGDITVEEVYNSFSLGIGADGVPGYPLLSVYLTGKELKLAAEIDASISDLLTYARLYNAGLFFSFNPNRMILNRVTDCYLSDETGGRVEIEDDKLYRVVSDMYTAQMLDGVTSLSYGLLAIELKHADGTPVEKLEDAIIYTEGKELKAWTAIAGYMESFADTDGDGIGNVPDFYGELQGRKLVENSKNLWDLIKNPNHYTAMIVGAGLLLLAGAAAILVLLKKLLTAVLPKIRKDRKN